MAEFIQKCPYCNTKLQMQDEWIDNEVFCPLCQNNVIVSKSSSQVPTAKIAPEVVQLADDEKICPLCGGIIKEKATFCKHCRQYLHKKSSVRIRCIIVHIIMVAIYVGAICGVCYLLHHPKYRKKSYGAIAVLVALGKYALKKIERNTK